MNSTLQLDSELTPQILGAIGYMNPQHHDTGLGRYPAGKHGINQILRCHFTAVQSQSPTILWRQTEEPFSSNYSAAIPIKRRILGYCAVKNLCLR